MAVFDMPTAMAPQGASFGLRKSGVQFRGPFNGTLQAVGFVSERWVFSATTTPKSLKDAGAVEAFLNVMAGGVNTVRAGHPARPVPIGTLRGSPVLQLDANRGDSTIHLGGCATGETLEPGDMFGLAAGSQLFQVASACEVDSFGIVSVPVVNRVRAFCAAGSAVVWDHPKALFNCAAMMNSVSFAAHAMQGAPVDFVEAWSAVEESSGAPSGALSLGSGALSLGTGALEFA